MMTTTTTTMTMTRCRCHGRVRSVQKRQVRHAIALALVLKQRTLI